jgi:hypothetical protein
MRLAVAQSKYVQITPNKNKRNRLVLLGFLWPNRGFSRGYGESKQIFFVYTDTRQPCAACMASACSKADLIASAPVHPKKTIVRVASVFSKKMTKILGRRSVSAYFEGVRLM